jgi:hypothetical protein
LECLNYNISGLAWSDPNGFGKVDINGCTGRFDGVSGDLTAEGFGYPIPPDATLSGEDGTITGTIKFSDQ